MRAFPSAAPAASSLREYQIRASLLLKDLRSDDPFRVRAASERFRLLPVFSSLTPEQLAARRDDVRRKHALAVMAAERGYPSWVALKAALGEARAPVLDTGLFFRPGGGAFLNHWFATYEGARECLEAAGGYLFPFGSQFFVCTAGFLEARGTDPAHPLWEAIGYDWVRPADPAARAKLEEYLVELGFAA